jgi:hypothetical protein
VAYFWGSIKDVPKLVLTDDAEEKEIKEDDTVSIAALQDVANVVTSLLIEPPIFLQRFFKNLKVVVVPNKLVEELPADLQDAAELETRKHVVEFLLKQPFHDLELARRHLVLDFFYYNEYPPDEASEFNSLVIAHQKFSADAMNRSKDADLKLREHTVAKTIALAEDLSAFGGMLRVYCPTRSNSVFMTVIDLLIQREDNEKLESLLTNQILENDLFEGRLKFNPWIPPGYEKMRQIRDIVGKDKFSKIERQHVAQGRMTDWIYRSSDIPNRHKHCNSNPYPMHRKYFQSYDSFFNSKP